MSRTSCNQYRLPSGVIVNDQNDPAIIDEIVKDGGVLWNGYDYEAQHWVHQGAKDTRTLEELRASLATV